MANSYHHALSSASRFGGAPFDYLKIHDWLDESKKYLGDFRHRALRHHTLGIFEVEKVFGPTIRVGTREIPVRLIAEQHIVEDCGYLPTLQDWLSHIQPQPWMNKSVKLSKVLDTEPKV